MERLQCFIKTPSKEGVLSRLEWSKGRFIFDTIDILDPFSTDIDPFIVIIVIKVFICINFCNSRQTLQNNCTLSVLPKEKQ